MDKLEGIQRAILAFAVLTALVVVFVKGALWGGGAFVGGLLGYLNFRWLRATVEKLMGEGSSKGKAAVAIVYSLKLVIATAVLAGLIFGLHIPAIALLIGLGAMPLGIIFEPVFRAVLPQKG